MFTAAAPHLIFTISPMLKETGQNQEMMMSDIEIMQYSKGFAPHFHQLFTQTSTSRWPELFVALNKECDAMYAVRDPY